MSKITVTTKSAKEIESAFAAVFDRRKPASKQKPPSQADRLEPYRKSVLKRRRQGWTWKEIAQGMADPQIGEHVSEKLLRSVFGAAEAGDATSPDATKPKSDRVILDHATGQVYLIPADGSPPVPIDHAKPLVVAPGTAAPTPAAAPPAPPPAASQTPPPAPAPTPTPPMTAKEHAAWDETLKQLIPPIVQVGLRRNEARNYTDRVVEQMKPFEAARFHAVVASELEGLTEASAAEYGIGADVFGSWRRKWVRS